MTGAVIRLMLASSSRRSNQRDTGRCGPAITCTEAPDVRWTDDGVAVGHRGSSCSVWVNTLRLGEQRHIEYLLLGGVSRRKR
jgi:hypothetical protein